jgi:transcriptional regulator GlxA family with amidase domain
VLLFDEVELLDVAAVCAVLGAAGRQWNFRPFKLVPIATAARSVDTRSQLRIDATASLAEHPSPEIVVVPGGYGARRAQGDPSVVSWLSRAGAGATHVLAIGNGTLLAASAGLVGDDDVAATPELAPALAAACPSARIDATSRFRESGKLITSTPGGAAAAAALRLVTLLLGDKQARQVAASLGLEELLSPGGPPIAILEPG